ncbi:MAG: hypothetical protein V2A66_04540 [Pseudomonadota bacterium]
MNIPFFPNTGDGTHCFQAALMMALAVVMRERKFTYDELDAISQKLPGKWTWPTVAMLWMIEQGLKVNLIEEFDYKAFVKRGEKYLIERFGEEVGCAQAEHSDIDREREIARLFIALAPLEYRVPELKDIKKQLKKGAVVILNVNAAALHGVEGYSGHFVVVCDVKKDSIILHDPGLPPYPALEVPLDRFDRAWGYPAERDKNLMAIKSH